MANDCSHHLLLSRTQLLLHLNHHRFLPLPLALRRSHLQIHSLVLFRLDFNRPLVSHPNSLLVLYLRDLEVFQVKACHSAHLSLAIRALLLRRVSLPMRWILALLRLWMSL